MEAHLQWKTKEGKVLRVSEMETSHIRNCMRMLERKCASVCEKPWASLVSALLIPTPRMNGELAQEAAEEWWLDAVSKGPPVEILFPVYKTMAEELKARNEAEREEQIHNDAVDAAYSDRCYGSYGD